MGELSHDKWAGTTYGNDFMHRWLIRGLRYIPTKAIYIFSKIFVVPPTMLINRKSPRIIYRYFRERHQYTPLKAAWFTLRNHWDFSEVVIDKFAAYAGKKFDIVIDNYDLFKSLSESPGGFIQLSSHIGNYEMAGYSLVSPKRLNALVFGGEKESVMANRTKMFEDKNIRMIPMLADMSHIFMINAALSNGEIVSMPCDRIFGSQKGFDVEILGAEARVPQGPFLLAATKNVPLLFTTVMKEGSHRYHITIHRIDYPAGMPPKRGAQIMADNFGKLLTATMKQYPTQWYNYFEFWNL